VQPNLTAAASGTISVAFYDRRLICPASGTSEAAAAGLALDTGLQNPSYTGPVPPYGASNYCVNTSIQFYNAHLTPFGNNIRISQHTWDPQLNSMKPHSFSAAEGFIGDYFGNIADGTTDITTSVSTFDDGGTNSDHFQQQVVAKVAIP
jgi:hypothetical protein